MYEFEGIIIAVISVLGIIIAALLKKRPIPDQSTVNTIEQRVTAINDIKYLQKEVKELQDKATAAHLEIDKIHGKIHDVELQIRDLK